jgi:hypothetical protein
MMPFLGRRPPSLFQILRPWLWLLVPATIALVLIALVTPGLTMVALRLYLVGVTALAALATLRAIATRFPAYRRSRSDLFGHRQPEANELPQRLREIERLVAYSRWSAADYEERLRPILYDIARQRLSAYRSVAVGADPAAARAVLGDRVWTLIAPVQHDAADQRVITIADLELVVTALEGLGVGAGD